MGDSAALLKQARDLFQDGLPDRAAAVVDQLLRESPRDATALSFRAYLLYTRGSLEQAAEAYRQLVELEPSATGHYANLGLICFKLHRFAEAQRAFERQLELQPGDAKALRSLATCLERQSLLDKALECFQRAGDVERVEAIRARMSGGSGGGLALGAAPSPVPDGGGDAPGPRRPLTGAVAGAPDVAAWLRGARLPPCGDGFEHVRAGQGELVVKVREKVFMNPSFCIGHRGVIVFAPASREADKAASKFGGRHGLLVRAEGNGDLVLSGLGRGLLELRLGGRLFVNWGSLVLCGAGISVAFDFSGLLREAFLASPIEGAGLLVLAVRGAPVVLSVSADLPVLARPETVVAWTDGVSFVPEVVPELKKLVGKDEALRYRFEGRGFVVLQSA